MNNQQQQPTKQQMEFASKQLTASLEVLTRTRKLKEQKRKSIVLNARAELGLLDIELDMIDVQIDQIAQAQAQNKENMKGLSGLILKPTTTLGLV